MPSTEQYRPTQQQPHSLNEPFLSENSSEFEPGILRSQKSNCFYLACISNVWLIYLGARAVMEEKQQHAPEQHANEHYLVCFFFTAAAWCIHCCLPPEYAAQADEDEEEQGLSQGGGEQTTTPRPLNLV